MVTQDVIRVGVGQSNIKTAAVGFHCLGSLVGKPDYHLCVDNTIYGLSKNLSAMQELPFIRKENNPLEQENASSLLYELFFDLPLASKEDWHLSHHAFFLRYGKFSHFDEYFYEIFNEIYSTAPNDIKALIANYEGWERYIQSFIELPDKDLKTSDKQVSELSESELNYLIGDYLYNTQNVCLPLPFIMPTVFSREQFLNGNLRFSEEYFWLKLANLDKNLHDYVKDLAQNNKLTLSSINAILNDIWNQSDYVNRRFAAGISDQHLLQDTISNMETSNYQMLLINGLVKCLRELKCLPKVIKGKIAQDCHLIFSLRINGKFLNFPLEELLLHQLSEPKLELVLALMPSKIEYLSDELLEQSLTHFSFDLPEQGQTYLFSFWLNQQDILEMAIKKHTFLNQIAARFDIPNYQEKVVLSRCI